MCSNPLASARSVPGIGARCSARAVGGRGAPRVDHDVPGAGGPALRRSTAWPAAWCRPGWRRPAGSRPPRRCRTAGTAARGRRRTPGCRRSPTRTCRTGRCSRWPTSAAPPGRICRGCKPSRWSARRRRRRRRRPARNAAGCDVMPAATRSSASSQDAGRSGLVRSPGTVRTSGVSSRSRVVEQVRPRSSPWSTGRRGWSGNPPAACSVAGRSPATMLIPHCSEQYGQWVAVGAPVGRACVPRRRGGGTHAVSVRARCFIACRRVLRRHCLVLTPAGRGCAQLDSSAECGMNPPESHVAARIPSPQTQRVATPSV